MHKHHITFLAVVALVTTLFTGCIKPVEPKVLEQASANETMFVIPLQGDTKQQAQFNSAAYFNEKKIATKEFQIPHRWLQTGRWEVDGQWIPTVKVIKVDRTPVTVQFAVDSRNAPKSDADAIWMESADSVGFSTGVSVSALVTEEDSATFLYRYQATSLRSVLASEIRARIQKKASEFAATYKLDELRSKKNEMIKGIELDVVPFFKERGITITTVGMFGGMTYENPDIQKAIDLVFVNQQAKETAAALLAAQKDINAKSEQATQQDKLNLMTIAQGESEAIRLKAQATADAVRMKAEADSKGIKLVNDATKEAQSNPLFLEIRKLEVEILKYNRWAGNVPTTLVEGSGNSGLNLFLSPADTKVQAAVSTTKP
jgi:hypothetical protein